MTNTNRKAKHIIAEASLRLAAKRGWDKVILDAVAKAAKIPLAQIKENYADTTALFAPISEYISHATFEACEKPNKKSPPHDRLFEILMARFDCLQNHRKAILSIVQATRRDLRMLAILAPAQIKAMRSMLDFAGLHLTAGCSRLTPILLWGIFLAVFRVWQNDETLDMSRTMAALDRYLRIAEKAATLLHTNFV